MTTTVTDWKATMIEALKDLGKQLRIRKGDEMNKLFSASGEKEFLEHVKTVCPENIVEKLTQYCLILQTFGNVESSDQAIDSTTSLEKIVDIMEEINEAMHTAETIPTELQGDIRASHEVITGQLRAKVQAIKRYLKRA